MKMMPTFTSTAVFVLSFWCFSTGNSLSVRSSDDATVLQDAKSAFPNDYTKCAYASSNRCALQGYTTYACSDGICMSESPAYTYYTYDSYTGKRTAHTDPAEYGPYCWYDCNGNGDVSSGVCGGAFTLNGDTVETTACA